MSDFRNERYLRRLIDLHVAGALPSSGRGDVSRGLIVYANFHHVEAVLKDLVNDRMRWPGDPKTGPRFRSGVRVELPTMDKCAIVTDNTTGGICAHRTEIKLVRELAVDKVAGLEVDWFMWMSEYSVEEIIDFSSRLAGLVVVKRDILSQRRGGARKRGFLFGALRVLCDSVVAVYRRIFN